VPVRPPQHRPFGWKPAPKPALPKGRFYGSQRWREMSRAVIARDGGICRVCGQPGATVAHHLVERRDGGTDDINNLCAVHVACHNRLHPEKGRRC
jgi:5-methylcytosine-specific restriction enzyme A